MSLYLRALVLHHWFMGHDIAIDFLAGTVARNGVVIRLGKRERTFAIALAGHPYALSRDKLAKLLFGQSATPGIIRAIRAYADRLRRSVDSDLVISDGPTYALGNAIRRSVEFQTAERLLGTPLAALNVDALEKVRLYGRRLRAPATSGLDRHDWYASLVLGYHCMGRELGLRIAREMAARRRFNEVIDVAAELTFDDPCDKEAWEEIIKGQLALGHRSAALHAFRFLRKLMNARDGVGPTIKLNCRSHGQQLSLKGDDPRHSKSPGVGCLTIKRLSGLF